MKSAAELREPTRAKASERALVHAYGCQQRHRVQQTYALSSTMRSTLTKCLYCDSDLHYRTDASSLHKQEWQPTEPHLLVRCAVHMD